MKPLDERGLHTALFDPILADALGSDRGAEGTRVLAVAVRLGHARVQLRDWMYRLVEASGMRLRKRWVDGPGKEPGEFVDTIESGLSAEPGAAGLPPEALTSLTVAPGVLAMFDAAERIAREAGRARIDDAVLTAALLETMDPELREMVGLWDDKLDAFATRLRQELVAPTAAVEPFQADGRLHAAAFEASGRRFCRRMNEDANSLGVKRITTTHMLYTMLGDAASPLAMALSVYGLDVKKELHASLSRELTRPGAKRVSRDALTRDAVFDPVTDVLRLAIDLARRRGSKKAGEADVHRAFLEKHPRELTRLLPRDTRATLEALKERLETAAEDGEGDDAATERVPIAQIEAAIKRRICGQDHAVDRVIPWIKRLRFGLPREGRPAAVFLFLGPTGAGKTQLAKELARHVFGDEDKMIFIEMGQYKTKESMSGFIGAPPGYVGYGEGKLTNGLRDKPECVVLFDEIEKADTSVFDVLLRFCDEGMISDPAGPVRDGRKCLIVLTTNAGQNWMREHFKAHPGAREDRETLSKQLFDAAMDELKSRGFRPEFLGRVDERISFLPFTLETCRRIVDGVLENELKKLSELKGITLEVTGEARDRMARMALDRSLDEGARGAPRAVNECIVTPTIDLVVRGEDEAGALSGPEHLIAALDGAGDKGTIRVLPASLESCRLAAQGTLSARLARILSPEAASRVDVSEDVVEAMAKTALDRGPGKVVPALVEEADRLLAGVAPSDGPGRRLLGPGGLRLLTVDACGAILRAVMARETRTASLEGLEVADEVVAVLARRVLEQASTPAATAARTLLEEAVLEPARALRQAAADAGVPAPRLVAMVTGIAEIQVVPA